MDQSLREQLVHRKESLYFAFVILFGILTYVLLSITIIGIIMLAILLTATIILHGLMMGGIRRNGVKLGEKQFPDLYEKAVSVAGQMGLAKVPDIYIVESEGVLNAFASRFFRKNMVVLYSGIFELIEQKAEKEVLFVLAHEFAHLKRRHVTVSFLLLPALWVPFLGNAYLRACEYTCDRYAAYYTESYEASRNALTMLAIGKELYKKVDQETYMEQIESEQGIFIWLNEKLSTHPHLPKRLHALAQFFAPETALVLKEKRSTVWIGSIAAVLFLALAGIGLWFGLKGIENLAMLPDMPIDGPVEEVEGITPLMEAAETNDLASIENQIGNGADINAADSEGSTALHWAVYSGQADAARLLAEHGADPNTVDAYDTTPLMSAVFADDASMAELLLEYGADPLYTDAEGLTAYDYAQEYGNPEVLEVLKPYYE
ncbi:M48 family metallopeptidase [Bacillus infantis]|uniref:M48 family metallopeptidase n=1 Tax=Bacillus infantis TaxID=324767 RepID=UPI0021CC807A|nr:M48 family metallopeptidase [Bacillus infantis]